MVFSLTSSDIGEVILFGSDSASFDLYDYFSGSDLTFSTDSVFSGISLPALSSISSVSFLPYDSINNSTSYPYTSYSTWSSNYMTYILDSYNTIAVLYALDNTKGEITESWKVDLGYPITQLVLWSSQNQTYAITITTAEINRVFMFAVTEFTHSPPALLDLWDIRYLMQLKTCQAADINFLPFIGNLFGTYGLVFIYNFTDPTSPFLIQSIKNYHADTFDSIAVDLAITVQQTSIHLIILDPDFGLFFYQNSEDFFDETYRLKLSQYGCLTDIKTVWNSNYQNLLNSFVITVGTCSGFVVIAQSERTQMFFVLGMNSYGTVYSASASMVLNDIHFSQLNDSSLMIVQDRINSQDVLYHVDLLRISGEFETTDKWGVFQGLIDYFYVRSYKDGVRLFKISLAMPILKVSLDGQEYNAVIIAKDGLNNTAQSALEVAELYNTNEPYFIDGYRRPQLDIEILVIFYGFDSTVFFEINNYISGNNLTYTLIQPNNTQNFSITNYDYSKLLYGGTLYIANKYYNALLDYMNIYLIYDEGIDIIDSNSFTTILNYTQSGILSVQVYDGFLFVHYYNGTNYYIDIIMEEFNQTITTAFFCEFFEIIGNYIICASSQRLAIYLNKDISYVLLRVYSKNALGRIVIIDLCGSSLDQAQYADYLFILSDNGDVIIVNLDSISVIENFLKSIAKFNVPTGKKITSSSSQIYVFTNDTVEIFTLETVFVRSVEVPVDIDEIFALSDFLFLVKGKNLSLIDGQQNVINSYYTDMHMEGNCKMTGVGFIMKGSQLIFLCNTTENYKSLEIYISQCPKQLQSSPCKVPLEFFVEMVNPIELSEGLYYETIMFSAENLASKLYISVVLKLVVYGQAVEIFNNNGLSYNYSIDYNVGATIDVLDIVSGNNMDLSLEINGKKIPDSEFENNPIFLSPKIRLSNIYNSTSSYFLSLTSITNTNYLIASESEYQISIFNITSSQNSTVSPLEKIATLNLTEIFGSDMSCFMLQYISTKGNSTLFAGLCSYINTYSNYWEGQLNSEFQVIQYCIIVWELDINTWEINDMHIYNTEFSPTSMQVITNSNSIFTIILLDESMVQSLRLYSNNNLIRISVNWDNGIDFLEFEVVNFYTLGLVNFFATSVDGIYNDQIYIVVADYWYGVRVLIVVNGTSEIFQNIPNTDNQHVVTLGVTAREVTTVTVFAMIVVYHFNSDMTLYYYVTRFPYTTAAEDIITLCSVLSTSNYYNEHYIAFPVYYTTNEFYFRIIDTHTQFSSALVKDLNFSYIGRFISLFAVFVNEYTLALIANEDAILVYFIGDYLLEIPAMDEPAYEKMKKKWNTTDFIIKIFAENDNNQLESRGIALNITMNKKNTFSDPVEVYWWVWLVVSVFSVVIIIVVKAVYKWVFRQRQQEMELLIN